MEDQLSIEDALVLSRIEEAFQQKNHGMVIYPKYSNF
jgi:hypothetical protein